MTWKKILSEREVRRLGEILKGLFHPRRRGATLNLVFNPLPVLFCFVFGACAAAQPRYFLGGGPGAAVLSGASGSAVNQNSVEISAYQPRLGALAHVFGGWHISEYVSLQGAWSANWNDLVYSASSDAGFFQQEQNSFQQNLGADTLLYFRNRRSFVRPFLSAGLNYMRFRSNVTELRTIGGQPPSVPGNFRAEEPGLRVAAGADLLLPNGWGFRYAFLENLQRNVAGRQLSPPAGGPLMTFQHIFGLIKYF